MSSNGIHTKSKKVIGVFGEVLADIFPDQTVLGGAPFNVARHLQAFGLHPVMITRTGHDALRTQFLQEMQRLKMDVSGLQIDAKYPTGQVKVKMTSDGHQFEILENQAYDHIHAGITHMVTMSLKPEMVYFGTLAQRSMPSRLALDKFLEDGKCPRFLDVNLRAPFYNKHTIKRSLLRSDIVKLNEEELVIIAKYFKIDSTHKHDSAKQLAAEFGIEQIIVTAGAQGAWMVAGEKVIETKAVSTTQVPLIDTVGAGDAFSAVCMVANTLNWDHATMIDRANEFASAICGIRGGAPTDTDFYTPFINHWKL
ncbi:MAG: carbohydrate kinase [Pseudomonadota bacterium]